MKNLIKVTFTPKSSTPLAPAIYYVETDNFNIAELRALQQLNRDDINRNRFNDAVIMSIITVVKGEA